MAYFLVKNHTPILPQKNILVKQARLYSVAQVPLMQPWGAPEVPLNCSYGVPRVFQDTYGLLSIFWGAQRMLLEYISIFNILLKHSWCTLSYSKLRF